MQQTIAGTISVRHGRASFIRDSSEALPLALSYHTQLKYRFMDGDRLTAHIRADRRGRLQVLPVKVLSRSLSSFVGIVVLSRGNLLLVPFARPEVDHFMIAEGDKGLVAEGEAVIARIDCYPSYTTPGTAKVIRSLGMFRAPGVDGKVVSYHYRLPSRFPRGARQLAKALAVPVGRKELKNRTDLRQKHFFTIDGAQARDFDDAVAIDRLAAGGFRLYVSIADVSHYVRPESILDQEAYRRGTSIYFPGYCIPMLPEELSNGICSLKPGQDRLTVTAIMEFDAAGRQLNEHFCPSVINSKARLTYNLVTGLLEGDQKTGKLPTRLRQILPDLQQMKQLSQLLQARRMQRGSIDFDLPEAAILFDQEGNVDTIEPASRTIAHRIIEEFMLAANNAVATHLAWLDCPLLYRIHEVPDPKRITQLTETLKCFGLSVKGWRSAHPRAFQELLVQAEQRSAAPVINTLLLQVMQRARYSPVNSGHFGLALSCYTHFTSPIRRYPDLMVHRVLKARLWPKLEGAAAEVADLAQAGDYLSDRERLAVEAERTALKLKKLFYLETHHAEPLTGIISGISDAGLFITLSDILVDGLLPFRLMDDYYQRHDNRMQVVGEQSGKTYTLGDLLPVAVDRIDPIACRLDLQLPGCRPNGVQRPAGRQRKRRHKPFSTPTGRKR
ncbi:MAG: ribonuclease R [Deltaproteobacteria bacterium]|nr:ribonuclease R [Candidatus Anaeroferrophillus wilburensis]MBN2888269.1 ribonuclease R [Deltaproteobacteria bacterium]